MLDKHTNTAHVIDIRTKLWNQVLTRLFLLEQRNRNADVEPDFGQDSDDGFAFIYQRTERVYRSILSTTTFAAVQQIAASIKHLILKRFQIQKQWLGLRLLVCCVQKRRFAAAQMQKVGRGGRKRLPYRLMLRTLVDRQTFLLIAERQKVGQIRFQQIWVQRAARRPRVRKAKRLIARHEVGKVKQKVFKRIQRNFGRTKWNGIGR